MGERGFPVTVLDDGGRQYAGSGALGQAGLLDLLAECADAVGGEPPREPLSEGELGALYDLDVEAYECLVTAGYEPVPPPTREQYIATYGTESSWIPFGPGMPTGANPDDAASRGSPTSPTRSDAWPLFTRPRGARSAVVGLDVRWSWEAVPGRGGGR